MFKRILVPTDGSPGARKAARTAFDLARTLDAGIVGVHVVAPYVQDVAYTGFGVIGVPVPLDAGGEERKPVEQDEALMRMRRRARREGVRFHAARMVDPLPVDAIARIARRTRADLIVMCPRGFGRLIPALSGDVSGGIFRRCNVPMLLVHEDEKAERQAEAA